MAPDLNSVPPSPRPTASEPRSYSSRRTSQLNMATPLPPASPAMSNILPSNQNAVEGHSQSPPITSPGIPSISDNSGVGTGPGPLRHPRPMTASDIYLELEKEQEAVVNRLTRELSMLRAAQNASVVSNASSTSTGLPDNTDQNNNHLLSGASHPAPSTRQTHQRTSSSNSLRSNSNTIHSTVGVAGNVTSGVTSRQPISRNNSNQADLSRQNSMNSRRSGASSPAPGSYQNPDHFPSFYQQRPSPHLREVSYTSQSVTSNPVHPEPVQSARLEDVAFHRQELEAVKRENEMLRRRIRELERTVRERRQSDASRTRSESVSTTASGVGRIREAGKAEDEVRVGESARGGGLR